jgi:hypothetical protein
VTASSFAQNNSSQTGGGGGGGGGLTGQQSQQGLSFHQQSCSASSMKLFEASVHEDFLDGYIE